MMHKQLIQKKALALGFKLRVDTLPRDKRAEYVFTHPSRPDRFWAYIDADVANAFLEGWVGGMMQVEVVEIVGPPLQSQVYINTGH